MSFRLRSLILLLTAICLWLGYEVEQLRRHRRATLAVSFIGATASFAVDESPSFYKRGLRKLLGADVRRRIEGLAFGGSDDEFAALLRIPGLERIERLELRGPKISDKSLASAAQLASLSKLTLIDTRVTDRGLYALWSAREQLDIDGHSQFALLHPTEFEHQQVLDLSGPHLTDAGLADQSRRITMQALTLDGVEVTGSGFRRLQMLPSLRVVYLRNARRLDQNGIAALSQLPKLHALYLDGSAISDA
ncbi:MAG: hypothetical protein QF805_11170, partial [Pirellulaceae bacterium]|nr:hypothetical protein [Pirellulaceae bacterium]